MADSGPMIFHAEVDEFLQRENTKLWKRVNQIEQLLVGHGILLPGWDT